MRISSFASSVLFALVCAPGCVDPGGPGGTEGEGEGEQGPVEPTLAEARASAVGRALDRVRVEVGGTDLQNDASGIAVSFKDGAGRDVVFFDSDFDGRPDSPNAVLGFDSIESGGDGAFTAVVTIHETPAVPDGLGTIVLSIVDAAGNRSAEQAVPVVLPPIVAEGGACDVQFIASRCDEGLGCKGEPAVCAPPEAPVVSRAAWLLPDDPELAGPRLAVEGIDADQDVILLTLEFLDETGAPVTLDLDGDGVDEAATFDLAVVDEDGTSAFTASHEMGLLLHDTVKRMAVTPRDALGLTGERTEVGLTTAPRRQVGQTCSTVGFDVCAGDALCAENTAGTTTCQARSTIRNAVCGDAPVLVVRRGETASIVGETSLTSAFELPEDCAPNSPVGRPDAVVILDVEDDLASLTVSTDSPATTFDTVVSVLPTCTAAMTDALVCADDGENTVASVATLSAMARGTYAVVIDSFRPEGGRFSLVITAE
jgi:hypothetical protein